MPKADLSQLSIEQLATVTGRDRRTVTSRLKGLDPVSLEGREKRYEAPAALKRIYLGDDWDLDRARARLAKEQGDKIARENALARGEIVPASEVEGWMVQLFSSFMQRIRALPAKAAPEAHGSETIAQCESVLRRHTDEALEEISAAEWIAPPVSEPFPLPGDDDRSGGAETS